MEIGKLGKPDCYFAELPSLLHRKRDEMLAVLREVGFNPIVPEGGYFVLADVSKFSELIQKHPVVDLKDLG